MNVNLIDARLRKAVHCCLSVFKSYSFYWPSKEIVFLEQRPHCFVPNSSHAADV